MLDGSKNGASWQWNIDSETQNLRLQLTEEISFVTQFKRSELIEEDFQNKPFSTSDAFVYSLYRDKFSSLPIDEEQAFTLALSATVSSHYLRPLATKSWFFDLANNDLSRPIQQGDWVTLNAANEAIYLVIDTDQTASNIVLVSKKHVIDEHKTFEKGKALRVHNDRMSPVLYELQEHQL